MTRERRRKIMAQMTDAVMKTKDARDEKEETERMEREGGPAGLSLAQYRNTPKGMREYEAWSRSRGPKNGRADFGGRRRTRRGRKSRSTRRR